MIICYAHFGCILSTNPSILTNFGVFILKFDEFFG